MLPQAILLIEDESDRKYAEKLYAEQVEAPPEGRRSVPGSVVWVPACAGLMLAGHVVQALAMPAEVDDQENQP